MGTVSYTIIENIDLDMEYVDTEGLCVEVNGGRADWGGSILVSDFEIDIEIPTGDIGIMLGEMSEHERDVILRQHTSHSAHVPEAVAALKACGITLESVLREWLS